MNNCALPSLFHKDEAKMLNAFRSVFYVIRYFKHC